MVARHGGKASAGLTFDFRFNTGGDVFIGRPLIKFALWHPNTSITSLRVYGTGRHSHQVIIANMGAAGVNGSRNDCFLERPLLGRCSTFWVCRGGNPSFRTLASPPTMRTGFITDYANYRSPMSQSSRKTDCRYPGASLLAEGA